MSESGSLEPSSAAAIAAMRERGADRFDPVRFRFIEALAGRAPAHRGEARRLLDARLATALSECGERVAQAQAEGRQTLERMVERFPHAADELTQAYGAGDPGALRRLVIDLEGRSCRELLADLVGRLAQQSPEPGECGPVNAVAANPGAPDELKSLRYFRNTWSKLSVDQQLAHALAQAPTNAGPLNSHLLVLRALKTMRDTSPDYLNRFMSYVDALLWLDQASGGGLPVQAVRGESEKKRKSGRGRAG